MSESDVCVQSIRVWHWHSSSVWMCNGQGFWDSRKERTITFNSMIYSITPPDNVANVHICGEHLLSVWHLLRKTNGYSHTIIKLTKRSSTYGERLLRMLPLLRSTVNNSNNRPNITPHRSHAIAPAISPRRRPLLLRQDLQRIQASQNFRAARTFRKKNPVSSGIPRSVLPDPGAHPTRLSRVSSDTPKRPYPRLPRKGGYPQLKGGLSPLCWIFRIHQHLLRERTLNTQTSSATTRGRYQ